MTLSELYDIANGENITVYFFPMEELTSFAMPNKIALNPNKIKSVADEKYCMAHEISHCQTGSFYTIHSKFDIRSRKEYRAKKYSYNKFLPKHKFQAAFDKGITEPWELAEYFNYPEQFIREAIEYYKNNR